MSSEVIKQAIRELKQVCAYRDGRIRLFCPHLIGWTDGEYRTLVWQFDGYSSQGLAPGGAWRGFVIADLTNASLVDGPWYRGWTQGTGEQHFIKRIELAVDPAHAAEVRQTSRAHTPRRALRRPVRRTPH